jgi:UDP-N-acetylmuramyl tripeptide synthase
MIAAADFPRTAAGRTLLDRLAQLGVPLADITADSRAVKLGSIFVAYPGTNQDGRAFIPEAIARGAAAVIWERGRFEWEERWEIPNLGVENLRDRISEIAGNIYGNPSESLWMVGVTGTNGKTSVSQWIAAACEGLGWRSAVIGTLGNGLVGQRVEAKNTTPDAIVLQRLLADYLRRGARVAAMEVSSHGLDQGRVAGIKYDVAIFTNLTRDHLDYHRSMDAYAEAKYRLFSARGLKSAIVNVDDEWGARFAARLAGGGHEVITFGTAPGARLAASDATLTGSGVSFHLESEWGKGLVTAPVLGPSIFPTSSRSWERSSPRGSRSTRRCMPRARSSPCPGASSGSAAGSSRWWWSITRTRPDALEKALEALRPLVQQGGRLICVFGCGGDRDPGKRSIMGATAARLADHVIVTSDNPRSEEPRRIIAQVLEGDTGRQGRGARRPASGDLLRRHHARRGDIVLLAGKGHETYQEIAGTRVPFSDADVARAALAEREQAA